MNIHKRIRTGFWPYKKQQRRSTPDSFLDRRGGKKTGEPAEKRRKRERMRERRREENRKKKKKKRERKREEDRKTREITRERKPKTRDRGERLKGRGREGRSSADARIINLVFIFFFAQQLHFKVCKIVRIFVLCSTRVNQFTLVPVT